MISGSGCGLEPSASEVSTAATLLSPCLDLPPLSFPLPLLLFQVFLIPLVRVPTFTVRVLIPRSFAFVFSSFAFSFLAFTFSFTPTIFTFFLWNPFLCPSTWPKNQHPLGLNQFWLPSSFRHSQCMLRSHVSWNHNLSTLMLEDLNGLATC